MVSDGSSTERKLYIKWSGYAARLCGLHSPAKQARPLFGSLCESAAAASVAPSDARRHGGQVANRLTNCSSSRSCASIA